MLFVENQNTEWKEKWSDEYLKWICGFANAQGGDLYIGCDDSGQVVGCAHCRKLLEDIPNKVMDTLGIMVDVDLLQKDNLEYLRIHVAPSMYPVNYKGEYHYRSGSTKQHMKGGALTQFLLERTQSTFYWDNVPMPSLRVQDLDAESLRIFRRRAELSQRMSKENLYVTDEELLRALGIMPDGVLTRAAALLFHAMPEQWFPGAYTKIAYFPNDADIAYMDEVHGSLFQQAERIPELLYLKYLKGSISYRGIQRIESYPFPREAVREAVLNSLIHSCYSSGIPVQIRVYDDKIYISNSTMVMNGWTLERYQREHRSEPFNPSLANAFYRAGFVESWGRGIEKICRVCSVNNACVLSFEGRPNSFMVSFLRSEENAGIGDNPVAHLPAIQQTIIALLIADKYQSSTKIAGKLGVSRFYISRQLARMQQQKLLRRVGSRARGYWEVLVTEKESE